MAVNDSPHKTGTDHIVSKKNPLVSVIVPVYRVEKYLRQFLESLVRQSYTRLEILIVDDGSPDGSHFIYEAYAKNDPRIRIIRQENAGVSLARNTGIEHATGELLMFADSDDWLELEGIQILVDAYRSSGADLVVADVNTVTEKKTTRNRVFREGFIKKDRDFIRQYEMACIGYGFNPDPAVHWNVSGLGSPWNKLFIRRIVMEYGLRFDSYVRGIYDDNLFTLHYLERSECVCYVPKPVYDYRMTNLSITQSYKADTPEISRRIFARIQSFMRETGEEERFAAPFCCYVVRRLSAELGVYYFSDVSGRSLTERMQELKHAIQAEPYRSAVRQADRSRLMTAHAFTALTARTGSPGLMYLMFRARRLLKRWI